MIWKLMNKWIKGWTDQKYDEWMTQLNLRMMNEWMNK